MKNIIAAWDNPERSILHIAFVNSFTWEDYHHALLDIKDLLADVDYPFVIINDYLTGTKLPKGSPYPHMQRTTRELPMPTLTCIVTRDPVIRRLVELSFKGAGQSGRLVTYVPSLDEAREQAHSYLEKAT